MSLVERPLWAAIFRCKKNFTFLKFSIIELTVRLDKFWLFFFPTWSFLWGNRLQLQMSQVCQYCFYSCVMGCGHSTYWQLVRFSTVFECLEEANSVIMCGANCFLFLRKWLMKNEISHRFIQLCVFIFEGLCCGGGSQSTRLEGLFLVKAWIRNLMISGFFSPECCCCSIFALLFLDFFF